MLSFVRLSYKTSFTIILFVTMLSAADMLHAQKHHTLSITNWKQAGMLPASPGQTQALGFAGPVAGIHNDVLLVAGGANFPEGMPWEGGKKKYYDNVFIYGKKNDSLILHDGTARLPATNAYAATCSTPAGIVYAGGENEQGISNKVWLLQWEKAAGEVRITPLPDLPVPLTNGAATVSNNICYIAGGVTAAGVSDQFYCLPLGERAPQWKTLPPLPAAGSHMVLVSLPDRGGTRLYLAGGRKKNKTGISDLYATLFVFDTEQQVWQQKKSMPYALTAGTGLAIEANSFVLFGGDTGKEFHQSELLAAAIAEEKNDSTRQSLIQQKNKLAAAHPGFSKNILLYNTITDQWKSIGNITFPAPVTSSALRWDDILIIPGGEIRAGIRTPVILSAIINPSAR